ncbi:MAG: AraC family transcriptional regulator ligand-binding domain-containing protein [Betaproteobacteria bacterium]|jgi:AraC-like DNA-binding protein|nr:AraC family transcriptional regulator ligand-binding domain-containing protein [Betaproteobacteria bacterium]MCC6250498.1 AraC family transcriptional regulator ligand-binding domain-containing protein [Rubrivivax sp.]MCL4697476.1 AraC family transcriptional regulator ligand-binding domain-containing protein [Burkholderiaceae bacterium]
MSPLVRSAALTHFAEVAAACGLDARVLVAQAGLPSRCLDEPDLKVPAYRVGRLLELAAERGREPAFGLRMARSRRLSNLGSLGLALRDEPTLRAVLDALIAHIHVHNEALALRVEESGNLVLIREELTGGRGQPLRQATELVVGVTFRLLSLFLGASWRPRLVCFSHRAPAGTREHGAFFGEAVEFGHQFNGIVCNAADLDSPNPAADPVMTRLSRRLLQRELGAHAPLGERVRQLVVLLLPYGHCRVEVVAQHLGIDRRTVARRLRDEGTTFSALMNGLRDDLLARHLDDHRRPLAEVAALLGFSTPSAFARWHRGRFGAAARSLRGAAGRG